VGTFRARTTNYVFDIAKLVDGISAVVIIRRAYKSPKRVPGFFINKSTCSDSQRKRGPRRVIYVYTTKPLSNRETSKCRQLRARRTCQLREIISPSNRLDYASNVYDTDFFFFGGVPVGEITRAFVYHSCTRVSRSFRTLVVVVAHHFNNPTIL